MKEAPRPPAAPARLLLLLAAGLRAAPGAASRAREPAARAEPLGGPAPPADINPVENSAGGKGLDKRTEAVRILSGVSLINRQIDLELAARLEVVCSELRTVTKYESEQEKVAKELLGVSHPGEVVRACENFQDPKKSIPATFFDDVKVPGRVQRAAVPVPGFPESLGEIVIEAVERADGDRWNGEHLLLELVGCTSCENDVTAEVEWGGLVPLDENGDYRKMYKFSLGTYWNRYGEAKMRGGGRQPIVEMPAQQVPGFPRVFKPGVTPDSLQKYVKTHKYKYSSTKYDQTTSHKVRSLAAMNELMGIRYDVDGLSRSWDSSLAILQEIRQQARHVPFNHKMEQLHMHLYTCDEVSAAAKLKCKKKPVETLIVHDGALAAGSSASVFLDEIGRRGSLCTFGPCAERDGIALNGVLHPYTMCSKCSGRVCDSSRTWPDNESLWLNKDIPENWFNCVVDRTHGPSGEPRDRLLQPPEDTDPAARRGSGLLFGGESALARVVGHINWHVTSLGKGHCQPLLQDAAFIGLGADEADACRGRGGVDLDLGAALLQCSPGPGRRQCRPMKQLLHPKYGIKDSTRYKNLAVISDDSRTGIGEGDDEWLYFRLAELESLGVTHIILTANIYGCSDGTKPRQGLHWKSLEGAFMRFVGSSGSSDLPAARTSSYIDLDEMQVGTAHGAAVAMLYLSPADQLATSRIRRQLSPAADKDKVWKVAALHKPITQDITDMVKGLSHLIRELQELSHEEQVATMDLDMLLTTGHALPGQTSQLRELIQDAARHDRDSKNMTTVPVAQPTDEQKAQALLPKDFWNRVGWVLPGGLPSADVQCIGG